MKIHTKRVSGYPTHRGGPRRGSWEAWTPGRTFVGRGNSQAEAIGELTLLMVQAGLIDLDDDGRAELVADVRREGGGR